MKRVFPLLLAVIFVFSNAACAPKREETSQSIAVSIGSDDPAPSETVSDAPTAAATAAPVPTDLPSDTPTDIPSDTPTDIPTDAPTDIPTDAPTDIPTDAPTDIPTDAPTNIPTNTPTAAPANTPTASSTAAPTETPTVPTNIGFTESASLPLPSTKEDVPFGQPFCFGGTVKSDFPILKVKAVIVPSSGSPVSYSVDFPASANIKSVELVDRTFPVSGNNSLSAKVKFESLAVGSYTFKLYASTTAGEDVLLKSSAFKVVKSEWIQLISNNFRNNYAYALSFFGSRDEFMFRYQWADSRNITVEKSWLNSHFTSVTSPSGKAWYVHKKAAASFNRAIDYMNAAYIHVGGRYDSGIIKLSSLVSTFDGTLNTRFVTDRTFISHHAFGTAIDLNASLDANRNVLSNRTLIHDEVKNHLVYNGIKEKNGIKYYDFTYNGNHASTFQNVPTTVINYLLYELAFYRAGFGWGYYYTHACDGMHFSVSELSPELHNTSSRALRKVYSYIG